jgi:hypothetical protein
MYTKMEHQSFLLSVDGKITESFDKDVVFMYIGVLVQFVLRLRLQLVRVQRDAYMYVVLICMWWYANYVV